MSVIARFLPDNPVLTKELRVRMRGARAYWILFGYLGFLSVLLWFQYYGWLNAVHSTGSGASEAARLGTEIFTYLLIAQMFLVLFITPAITSGALTIEKEQRTLDMLTLTRLPRHSIILGKLLSAVSFTALLIISSLPLISICFMLGSIDPKMVVSTYLEMLMGSVLIGAVGLMWSSVLKTTTTAVMATYGCLFLLFVLAMIGWGMHFGAAMGGGGGGMFGSSMNAIYQSWFGPSFLGVTVIEGIGFGVFCALSAWLLCAVAMVRLEMFPERKALLLRILAAVVVGVQILSLDSWWVHSWYNRGGGATMVAAEPPIGVLLFTCMALLFLMPIFGTGEVQPYEARNYLGYLAKGWTPKGLRRGKLHSGLPYMLLLTLLLLGLYTLPFVVVGKAASITSSSIGGSASAPAWNGGPSAGPNSAPPGFVIGPNGRPMPAPTPAPAPKAAAIPKVGDFPQAAIALLATMLGLGLFCQFLSVAFRSRWIAWLIASLLLVLIFIVPEISTYSANTQADLGLFNQLLCDLFYLNPLQSVLQMIHPVNYMEHRYLTFPDSPVWQVTTYSWLAIGGLSFIATLPFARREGKRQVPIPYEEQVMEA
ncbi:MAG: family transporter protein [Chthonomonadaceae bacterium]|nr:family transporter protein [Chthonomonadaceae bacterium]